MKTHHSPHKGHNAEKIQGTDHVVSNLSIAGRDDHDPGLGCNLNG